MPNEGNTLDLSDEALGTDQEAGSGDQSGTAEGAPSQTGAQGQDTGDVSQETTESQDTSQGDGTVSTDEALAALEKLDIDPATKEMLRKGYLRQADYTKKTQDLASAKDKAEAFEKLTAYLEEQMGTDEESTTETKEEDDGEAETAEGKTEKAIAFIKELARKEAEAVLGPIQRKEKVNAYVQEFKDLVAESPDAKEHWETLLEMVVKTKRATNFKDAYVLLRSSDLIAQAKEQGKQEGLGETASKDAAYVEPAGPPASREGTVSEDDQIFDEIQSAGGRKLFR